MKKWWRDSYYNGQYTNTSFITSSHVEVRHDYPCLDALVDEDVATIVQELNKENEEKYLQNKKLKFLGASEMFKKYTGKLPTKPWWFTKEMEKDQVKCCSCKTTKEPVVEPEFALGEHYIIGYRAVCLGVNEGLDCHRTSPLFVNEEDAAKYGVAYLKGIYEE